MYSDHPSFESVPDDTKIWRFMDFAKYCDLIDLESIFFVRPENFPDPWEGHTPRGVFADEFINAIPENVRELMVRFSKQKFPEIARKEFAVSCWHVNDVESEALWQKYSDRGIAVQSTFGRLKHSFDENLDYEVHIGTVIYKDHMKDKLDTGNIFNQVLWKKKSFAHECELRAVIWEKAKPLGRQPRPFDHLKGQHMRVSLATLVEKVYTSPLDSEDWFSDVVKRVTKKYGYDFPVLKSDLMDLPQ